LKKPPERPVSGFDALLRSAPLSRLEARVLLAAAAGRTPEWLIAHGDEPAGETVAERFIRLVDRRVGGEPIAYLTGVREFYGRSFRVTPAVLIPRPETERLVDVALGRLAGRRGPRVLDLGTGSGAIAVTLALERPDACLVATDCSEDALEVARGNAAALGAGRIAFHAGQWWQALPVGTPPFDLVASNPPYVAATDPHLSRGDLRHEPRGALAAGDDGLDALRELTAGAATRLVAGGSLAVEHGFDQGDAVRTMMRSLGYRDVQTLADLAHRERVTIGVCRG